MQKGLKKGWAEQKLQYQADWPENVTVFELVDEFVRQTDLLIEMFELPEATVPGHFLFEFALYLAMKELNVAIGSERQGLVYYLLNEWLDTPYAGSFGYLCNQIPNAKQNVGRTEERIFQVAFG